eukprot:COSAG01_NODE_5249_length_4385_cov_9.553663_4_plen_78_part_00
MAGWAALAQGLCDQQEAGIMGALKLRLVHCKLSSAARGFLAAVTTVPPPPLTGPKPPEFFEPGGIPILIGDMWYRRL